MSDFALTIVLKETGEVAVNGPIQNKALCYAILAAGQEVIREYVGAPQVIAPRLTVPKMDFNPPNGHKG